MAQKTVILDCDKDWTVERIKDLVCCGHPEGKFEGTGLPPLLQCLVSRGTPLEIGRTLNDYRIGERDTLYVLPEFRGPGKQVFVCKQWDTLAGKPLYINRPFEGANGRELREWTSLQTGIHVRQITLTTIDGDVVDDEVELASGTHPFWNVAASIQRIVFTLHAVPSSVSKVELTLTSLAGQEVALTTASAQEISANEMHNNFAAQLGLSMQSFVITLPNGLMCDDSNFRAYLREVHLGSLPMIAAVASQADFVHDAGTSCTAGAHSTASRPANFLAAACVVAAALCHFAI